MSEFDGIPHEVRHAEDVGRVLGTVETLEALGTDRQVFAVVTREVKCTQIDHES